MPQNYAGRVTLIIVVLLVGLFGIPPLTDGIFSLSRFFSSAPFGEKLNLKPGIDIAGGYSLLYEIKPPPGVPRTGEGTLAEDMAKILKKRVDPQGVRNLVWRPQGDTRLEIQIPRSSMAGEGSGKIKADYTDLTRKLEALNVTPAQVMVAVETLTGDKRAEVLKTLAGGNKTREELFNTLAQSFDKIKQFEAQRDELKKSGRPDEKKQQEIAEGLATARIAYDDARKKIDSTNLQVAELQTVVNAPAAFRDKELASIEARFPERKALIEQFKEVYPKYAAAKDQIDDSADLKRLLRGSGVLEFHIIAVPEGFSRGGTHNPATISTEEWATMVTRLQNEGPTPQAGDKWRWYEIDKKEQYGWPTAVNPRDGKEYGLAWIVAGKQLVHSGSGRDWSLQRASREQNQNGESVVGFEFDDVGAALFSTLTGENIGKPLGTILDNRIITAPNINSQIGKRGVIEGRYKEAELTYLISTLNAGSLPAQLAEEPISERQVGPQLGAANLRTGLYSCMIGMVVVAIFLIGYYHLAGLVAMIGMFLNLVVILGVLGMMGATFTLPGIAALVLTIGMAVDANVLIFERLREEQLRGLSLKLALRNAYDRAFTAILDSNVTTAITSAFLIYFGSEEVKGFGLTLLIGILASMFAALFVTKTVFGIMIDKYGLRKLGSLPLSFPRWNQIMHPKVDWMGKFGYFLGFSIVFGLVGMVTFVQQARKGRLLDVEFAAGTEVQFTTTKPMSDGDVRERVAKRPNEIPQPAVVAVGEEVAKGEHNSFSVVTANVNRAEVSRAVLDVMHDVLDVVVPSKFANNTLKADEAIKAETVRPIVLTNNRFVIDGQEIPDAPQHAGGAAVVLKDLQPPLSVGQISDRIAAATTSAGAEADIVNRFTVNRLDGGTDPAQPVSNAVVLFSGKGFDYAKNASDWRDKFASLAWKLTNEGVGREASLQKVSNFDPQVAGDTQRAAIFATLGSMIAIMVWIWLRFGDHKYGTATVLAMLHDTVLVVAAIGVAHLLADNFLGRMLGLEAFRVNMTLVAAILTVMGYSMVDTIVVFDRIRENRGKYGTITRQLVNDSINQTLSRTLLTAGTTIVTLLVMYIWGGPAIHGFAYVLFIGILIGTYSSIAVAAPFLLMGTKPPAGGGKSVARAEARPVGSVEKVGA